MSWKRSVVSASMRADMFSCAGDGKDEREQRLYAELRLRDDAHHAASLRLSEPAAVRDETRLYSEEMNGLMDEMMAVCANGRPWSSMRHGHWDGLSGVIGRMKTDINEHRMAIDAMSDLENMRAECEEHHSSMDEMLDEMVGMMATGIGGGGMM
jgi:hypothetical protein